MIGSMLFSSLYPIYLTIKNVSLLSHVRLFVTPWTVAYEAPPSMGFSRQEYWSGSPFPSPEDLPDPGIKPGSPALQADALPSKPYLLNHVSILFTQLSCPLALTYTYLNHSWRYLWFLLTLQKLQWYLDIILQEKIFLPIYLINFWFESIKGNRFDLCTIFWWTQSILFVSGRKRQILLFSLLCSLYYFLMSPKILNFNFYFGLKMCLYAIYF